MIIIIVLLKFSVCFFMKMLKNVFKKNFNQIHRQFIWIKDLPSDLLSGFNFLGIYYGKFK